MCCREMISYTPAVVFGLLRGELVMMSSIQSNLLLPKITIVNPYISGKIIMGFQIVADETHLIFILRESF